MAVSASSTNGLGHIRRSATVGRWWSTRNLPRRFAKSQWRGVPYKLNRRDGAVSRKTSARSPAGLRPNSHATTVDRACRDRNAPAEGCLRVAWNFLEPPMFHRQHWSLLSQTVRARAMAVSAGSTNGMGTFHSSAAGRAMAVSAGSTNDSGTFHVKRHLWASAKEIRAQSELGQLRLIECRRLRVRRGVRVRGLLRSA